MTRTILSSSSSLSPQQAGSPVIVALDYADARQALAFADRVAPSQCRLKIGKEMFTQAGPALVRDLQQRGFEVFLDLKFHDIPNTVAKAVSAAAELGVWMVNVHASGGERMMAAAREALVPFGADAPVLIAVTVLTSMNDEDLRGIGIAGSASDHAVRLAILAQACGLDGVVCSAWEAARLKTDCGAGFALVTPGIRPTGSDAGDQRRVMTPLQAQQVGVDYMVIGRPITQAADPAATLAAILQELQPGGADV
ncbi:Orotidine 5'-phosphate decarboxylase [Sodalis glossinidius str. 'morsitans']|uniref:Orotidine 5'-phosphate decarboxylase n=2 Tax=Sodalis glossinidius (strain morsitans) TaxID=343509 RepID=PYRF_SODGM|nr:orotidine-5'-phosphate decarboxylase [Sodalis glossinidius]Q2NT36.1 RecName: Full=Orotidine 5'-phosphate decarboxylase; AltName: Full=OMP decarboxylase; Short=OMPDCase; Short=OMPdecase [Sodalis glossinidius str. 'morsitans']BAE74689.1 orotidine 5'-phosphate decarboxylase [Sodalis glossinidius str. 'morsitans']CRL45437.1 Orotidine 5'-phosphate decarboxylase [Sodalis glossinidius str. 'morsitans']